MLSSSSDARSSFLLIPVRGSLPSPFVRVWSNPSIESSCLIGEILLRNDLAFPGSWLLPLRLYPLKLDEENGPSKSSSSRYSGCPSAASETGDEKGEPVLAQETEVFWSFLGCNFICFCFPLGLGALLLVGELLLLLRRFLYRGFLLFWLWNADLYSEMIFLIWLSNKADNRSVIL